MRKRLVVLTGIMALSLGILAGCGSKDDPTPTPAPVATEKPVDRTDSTEKVTETPTDETTTVKPATVGEDFVD